MNTGASDSTDAITEKNIKIVSTDTLRPHEQVDQKRVEEIARCIRTIGLQYPVVADRKTNIILDGHHRYNAFRKMKIKNIPVYYIDYEDKRIILDSWTGNKITKEDVTRKSPSVTNFNSITTKPFSQISLNWNLLWRRFLAIPHELNHITTKRTVFHPLKSEMMQI